MSVDVGADAWERPQSVSAVLISLLSWTRLLGASASNERMGRNRDSVKFSDGDRDGKSPYLQCSVGVWRLGESSPILNLACDLA